MGSLASWLPPPSPSLHLVTTDHCGSLSSQGACPHLQALALATLLAWDALPSHLALSGNPFTNSLKPFPNDTSHPICYYSRTPRL